MDESYPLLVVVVGVGIHVRLVTVSSPSSVTYANAVVVKPLSLKFHSFNTVAAEAIRTSELGSHEFSLFVD